MNATYQYPPIESARPSFEPAALQRILDGDHRDIRELIRQIVTQPEFRYFDGADYRAYRKQVLAWTKRVADAGIGRIFMPKNLGGEDNLAKFIAAGETLAFHDLSLTIKFGVQFGLFAGSILRLGTELHHRKYLPDAASCRLLGCFAMTEIGHGSNVQALETTATFDPEHDEFIVHSPSSSAGKAYIGNAANDGRLATVFAQLSVKGVQHGVHAFLVPLRGDDGSVLPGITIEDDGLKMGLNGVDNGRIWFDHVRVPRTALLNRFADVDSSGQYQSPIKSVTGRFFTMINTLVGGRIGITASGNSVAKTALTIAIRYAARRRQFGPAPPAQETLLLDYAAAQRRLMPLLANVYAIDFAVKDLVALIAGPTGETTRASETLAAALKAWATWNTTRTIQICREICGGEGYIASNRFSVLKADSDVFVTFEGDNTVLMQLVAKNLLTDLKDKLKAMQPAKVTEFFVQKTLGELVRRLPLFTLNSSRYHLLEPAVQLNFFESRASRMLLQSATRFRRLAQKMDSYTAFTRLQPDLLDLAGAYIEHQVLKSFVAAIQRIPDGALRTALKKLCDLFALYHLEAHKGWYLENSFMSGLQTRAITKLVTGLCSETRNDALAFVDAFGIPEALLDARIARKSAQ